MRPFPIVAVFGVLATPLESAFVGGERSLGELIAREHEQVEDFTVIMTAVNSSTQPIERSLRKRTQVSYPINQCPGQAAGAGPSFTQFGGSLCMRRPVDRWQLTCGQPPGTPNRQFNAYYGNCDSLNNREICVDGIHAPNIPITAYCVQVANFVKLALGHYGSGKTQQVRVDLKGTRGLNYAFEQVVVGGGGPSTTFTAASMLIDAQDTNGNSLSSNSCTECSSIGIEPLPSGFDHMVTTVTLPDSNSVGLMYGAIIVPGTGF